MKQTLQKILIIVLAVLLLNGCTAVAQTEQPAGSLPKHIVLSWADDPKTTQTITWQTVSAVKGRLEYAPLQNKPGTGVRTVAANIQVKLTNKGELYIHTAQLTGLNPGTRYQYRVGGDSVWSEYRQFETAPAKDGRFQFLVFGDSQSTDYNVWRTTLHQSFSAYTNAAFFINVGDLVDTGQDFAEWDAWLTAGQGIVDRIPVMPATGNHETYTPERKFSPPVLFKALFSLPQNGPDGLEEQAYSFEYGDVHFVVLDSQAGEQKQFFPDLLARQQIWLDKNLSEATKAWKIVILHRPPFDNKPLMGNAAVRNAFTPLFDKHKVDIVFTGHDHVYARTYPLKDGKLAPGGTIYVAAGRSGTKTYRLAVANSLNEFFYNPLDKPNYLHVEVTSTAISVKAVKQNGELIDAWEKTKGR